MKEHIYVVMGTTGEYSDRIEWPVAAYDNARSAQAHVTQANEFARLIQLRIDDEDDPLERYDYESGGHPSHPLDPSFQIDYTGGTHYFYVRVPWYNSFQEAKT